MGRTVAAMRRVPTARHAKGSALAEPLVVERPVSRSARSEGIHGALRADGHGGCSSCASDKPVARVLAQKTASAYVVIRLVRLLQARAVVPGHGGLEVRGVHVHHLVHGGVLLTAQHLWGVRREVCLHRPARTNVLCTGVALVVDEFDIVTGTQGRAGTPAARLLIDLAALVGTAFGLADRRRTWLRGP